MRTDMPKQRYVRTGLLLLAAGTVLAITHPLIAADDGPRVVELRISPAPEPDPALRFRLLPPLEDQIPANANSMLYMAAHLAESANVRDELKEELYDWLEWPVQDLAMDNVGELLTAYDAALRYARMAAKHEWCQWDMPIRSEGFSMLLPSLAKYRILARLFALQARIHIHDAHAYGHYEHVSVEGKYNQALAELQSGYALARHVGSGETVINSLVGAAMASLMNRQVELWVSRPDSPNLYWALANLPDPFVPYHRAFEYERMLLYLSYPLLRDLENRVLSQAQCEDLLREFAEVQSLVTGTDERKLTLTHRAMIAAWSAAIYPQARQYVLDRGHSEEKVESMRVLQVCLIYSLDRFAHWRDGCAKWWGLPYYQAERGLEAAEKDLGRIHGRMDEGYPFTTLLPSLARAAFLLNKTDREIRALQTIEAIRMQIALEPGNGLPRSIDEITVAPIPIDPFTGKPFEIAFEEDRIIINAHVPERISSRDAVQYVLRLAD